MFVLQLLRQRSNRLAKCLVENIGLQNAGKSPNGTFTVTRPMLQASFWLNSEKEDKKCIVIYCDKL